MRLDPTGFFLAYAFLAISLASSEFKLFKYLLKSSGPISLNPASERSISDLQSEKFSFLLLFPQFLAPTLRHLTKAPEAYALGQTE